MKLWLKVAYAVGAIYLGGIFLIWFLASEGILYEFLPQPTADAIIGAALLLGLPIGVAFFGDFFWRALKKRRHGKDGEPS